MKKNLKKTILIAALLMTSLGITLVKYEKWSFGKDEEGRFHAATLTLFVGGKQHAFVYGDPLIFFDDLCHAQMAREKGTGLVIRDSRFAGAGIARIRCEINAHSQNVEVELERESLASLQICHCPQRSELTYLDKMGIGLSRLKNDIRGLIATNSAGDEKGQPGGQSTPEQSDTSRLAYTPND